MACTARLVDLIKQCAAITVDTNFFDLPDMPTGFSFPPGFIAASGVVVGEPVFCVAVSASGET